MKNTFFLFFVLFYLTNSSQVLAEAETAKKIPPPPPPADESVKELILDRLGMTPEEIAFLKKEKEKRSEVASSPPIEATSVTRTITLDLSPGAPSQSVRVNTRKGAALIFTDTTGAPWPVVATTNFAIDFFQVLVPLEGGSVVTVSARNNHKDGNIAIFLKDLPTPVILSLSSGEKKIDERVDIILPLRGPDAIEQPLEALQIPIHDPLLVDVLSGLPPRGGKRLVVKLPDGTEAPESSKIRAWKVAEKMYIRTPFTIMSPGPLQYQGSADGMKGYILNLTPVILFSEKGKTHQIRIEL